MFGDQNMSDKESYQKGLAFIERYALLDDDYCQECINYFSFALNDIVRCQKQQETLY